MNQSDMAGSTNGKARPAAAFGFWPTAFQVVRQFQTLMCTKKLL